MALADTPKRWLSSDARWVVVSVFFVNISLGIQNLVVAKLLFSASGSTVDFGLTLVIEQILTFALQLFAGPIVDRGNPKIILLWSDVIRGGAVCFCSFMLTHGTVVFWVVVSVVFVSAVKPFYSAGSFSIGPIVAQGDSLLEFNSVRGSFVQAGQMVGTAIAGPLLYWTGPKTALAVNGIPYLWAAAALGLVTLAQFASTKRLRQRSSTLGFVHDWKMIVDYLKGRWGLVFHVFLISGDFLVALFLNIALVPIVVTRLHDHSYWLSVLDGSFAVGSLVMSLVTARTIKLFSYLWSVLASLGSEVVLFAVLAEWRNIFVMAPTMFLFGVATTVSVTSLMTSLQQRTPQEVHGKMASLRRLTVAVLSMGLVPLITHEQNLSLRQGLLASAGVTWVFFLAVFVLGSKLVFGPKLLGTSGNGHAKEDLA